MDPDIERYFPITKKTCLLEQCAYFLYTQNFMTFTTVICFWSLAIVSQNIQNWATFKSLAISMQEPVLLKMIFKTLQDYIQNDSLSSEINDHISEIMCYIPDPEPGPSCSMDKKINTFGRRLISICKSSHVRIVNGRHQFDPDESFTYCGPNG